jgi:hypothetical protein
VEHWPVSGPQPQPPSGVHVATTESFAGEPVRADVAGMQALLDASLVSWLGHLKEAAESRADSGGR